nr:immunoglobulin light chain junction region [Macaca mulatta]MOY05164.1 immunoglobulin light chain junction region [Macaca mulatta]MOY05300.1 immunoglobulin light chain junction region [Macaca mulatta]MOY05358.1 immunoglobulin light chain junction region [Macaca mulatta]MOY05456.1 immunoglobulin light chain junction region [Macaca mulatta]
DYHCQSFDSSGHVLF